MIKQGLHQKLQQKFYPQQIQLMKLVQLPTYAFEERIIHELEDNPALEGIYNDNNIEEKENKEDGNSSDFIEDGTKVIDTSSINIDEYLSDDEIPSYYKNNLKDNNNINYNGYCNITSNNISFYEYLKEQLYIFNLDQKDFVIANFILENLDENGYLNYNITSLVEEIFITLGIKITEKKLEKILINFIQKLDPLGVGARCLQECLCIQLIKSKNLNSSLLLAYNIIKYEFKSFYKKHFLKIQEKFKISENELKKAIYYIKKLNPKPGIIYSSYIQNFDQITPDFIINIINDKLELYLNNKNLPDLKISNSYIKILENFKNSRKKYKKNDILFIKQKLDSAKWFIDAVKQREKTLMLTVNTIVDYQKKFFISGDKQYMKPMILKDIADKINMDISTVSRVINAKYISSPYGTFLLKNLFSEGILNKYGKEISTIEIKKKLSEYIKNENKKQPFTDGKLVGLLNKSGYILSRRTVVKYRKQLSIPVSRLRRSL